MRVLRLLKIGKAARLFRVVQFVKDLRVMLLAIQRSLGSLFWCICFLGFILYFFGLIIVQGVAQFLADADDGSQEYLEGQTVLLKYFGSMQATSLSLYKGTTGGDDWGLYYDVLLHAGDMYGTIFLFYTAFFTFTV